MLDQRPRCIDLGRIHRLPVRRQPTGRHHEGGAAQIANVGDLLALGKAMGKFDDGALGIAEEQQSALESGSTERRTLSDQ
jgi:hypothetical protein